MDLRDRFAVHFAAALVDVFPDADEIARRAYDLAEALLEERARRIDADAGEIAAARPPSIAAPPWHGALLDEPTPMLEPDPGWEEEPDPSWLEPPYDPSWDLDVHWSNEAPATPSRPPGPGLARTQPEQTEAERKERSA